MLIIIHCGRCKRHPVITLKDGLQMGRYGLYYRCPNYYMENRLYGEPVCTNHFPIKAAKNCWDKVREWAENGELEVEKTWEEKGRKMVVLAIEDQGETVHISLDYIVFRNRKKVHYVTV